MDRSHSRTKRWVVAALAPLSVLLSVDLIVAPTAGAYSLQCHQSGIGCISQYGYTGQSIWNYPVDGAGNNCTNYAAFRLSRNGASNPGNLGNAGDWAMNARAKGLRVNGTPTVGAIAQWNYGSAYAPSSGHVAYVDEVTGSEIALSDSNWQGGSKRWRVSPGDSQWPSNFIHIKDVGQGQIAFQANTGQLYTVGAGGIGNWNLGMMKGTSPSISSTGTIAFQANTGQLYTVGAGGIGNWNLGMMSGTSPSISSAGTIAFQANTGQLYTVGPGGIGNWNLGMMSGTSPSIP